MGTLTHSLTMYRELAEWYERLGQTTMRDRFLMLAADAATQLHQTEEAERLRMKLLQGSRHHMLRPYGSWAEAAAASDVQAYLRDLRLNYPPEEAERLLATLKQGGGHPVDRTMPLEPLDLPPAKPLPFTAPMMDLNGPSPEPAARARVARPLAEPYPLEGPEHTPAPPRPAQQQQQQQRKPAAPRQAAAPPAEEAREPFPRPKNGASWLNAVLMVLTLLSAAAVAALALGRPFVPEAWLK